MKVTEAHKWHQALEPLGTSATKGKGLTGGDGRGVAQKKSPGRLTCLLVRYGKKLPVFYP